MSTVKISPSPQNTSYPIHIDFDVYAKLPALLKKEKHGEKYFIITDSCIKNLYGKRLYEKLKKAQIPTELLSVPAGEKSKSWDMVLKLCTTMLKKGCNRKCCVIALGGGVVGDLAGFVAATFMRGIPFIQIPTSLLAMVDSSVGGKTGVNMKEGKNLLGAFHQPKAVLIDLAFIKKLPQKQLQIGLAEVVKYGIIWDKKFFEYLEKNVAKILKKDTKALKHVIEKSVKIKATIINKDVKESGLRMILNYGHTYGHALEAINTFKLSHGEAISIGMNFAGMLGEDMLQFKEQDRVNTLLKVFSLPTKQPQTGGKTKLITDLMMHDKKARGEVVYFILQKKIGTVIVKKISKKALGHWVKAFTSINT